MNQTCDNSGEQIKNIVMNKNYPVPLCVMLEDLCNSLLIGQETYLRNFKSDLVIPVFMNIMEKALGEVANGDVLVMSFRAVSLIMEFVPSSYSVDGENHLSLLKLAAQAMHRALGDKLPFRNYSSDVLIEECLRVIRFVGKDDRCGITLSVINVKDLLDICGNEQGLLARQGLETFLTLCSKVIFPSEMSKIRDSFFFKLFHTDQKVESSGQSHLKAKPPHSNHPLVVCVENVIGPFLFELIKKFSVLDSNPEVWSLFEIALQCLGTLIKRSLFCYRPSTARAISYNALPALIFKVISQINQNMILAANTRNERILMCETFLIILASSNRKPLMDNLLELNSIDFFSSLFEHTEFSITTSLEDPFKKVSDGGLYNSQWCDKDNIITISGIYLFIAALPQIPLEAFGRKPKFPLPVHHWMWEDEMRHSNHIGELSSMLLELDYFRLSRNAFITIHMKTLPVDLHQMTLFRRSDANYRNIFRCFTPFVYRYVKEKSLRPVLEKVKEDGPKPTAGPTKSVFDSLDCLKTKRSYLVGVKRPGILKLNAEFDKANPSLDSFDNTGLPQKLGSREEALVEGPLTVSERYFLPFCAYATQAPGRMAKELAVWACAAMLRMSLLAESTHPQLERLLDNALLPLCEMARRLFTKVGKTTLALMVAMVEWLLSREVADPLRVSRAAVRSGLLAQLTALSATTTPTNAHPRKRSKESLEKRCEALQVEITMRFKRNSFLHVGTEHFEKSPGKEYILQMSNAIILQQALHAIKEVLVYSPDSSDLINKPIDASDDAKPLPLFERKIINNFFVALQASSHLTSYELQNLDLASVILQYLLNNKTTEDLFGQMFVHLSGASGSTFSPSLTETEMELSSVLNKLQLQWVTMMNFDTDLARLLDLQSHQPRVRYFFECARQMPGASELLIRSLAESLNQNNDLPLIESVAIPGKVRPRTPLYAFEALNSISPCVVLCSKSGKVASRTSAPETPLHVKRKSYLHTENRVSGSNDHPSEPQRPQSLLSKPVQQSSGFTHDAGGNATFEQPKIESREVAIDTKEPRSPLFKKSMKSPPHEQKRVGPMHQRPPTDIFSDWHNYIINKMPIKPRHSSPEKCTKDRVHLFSSIGDIERLFRLGTTSSKGSQNAPGPVTSLNIERLITRVESFLERQITSTQATEKGKGGVEVARLLKSNRLLLQKELENAISLLQTLRIPPVVCVPSEPTPGKPKEEFTSHSTLKLSEEQAAIASKLILQAIEERYILYRPFTCGPCPLQSTFLSHLYHQCVLMGNKDALLQLEDALLTLDPEENKSEKKILQSTPIEGQERDTDTPSLYLASRSFARFLLPPKNFSNFQNSPNTSTEGKKNPGSR
ncbi:unnamed protein product [Phytomonas sp. Hart1]|nr:unnamed protein product [Phytomonas sp. Hart1]|eukprot:CCW69446.1 unnamed protein product [Phytomonas sp. isolate Hart1]